MLVAMVVREAEAARKETSQPSVGVMLLEQGLENCRSVNGFFFFFKGYKNKQRRICYRDHQWSTKPKVFII